MSDDVEEKEIVYGAGAFSTSALELGRYAVELRTGCRFWGVGDLAQPRPFSFSLLAKKPKRSKKSKRPTAPKPPKPTCRRPVWSMPALYCAAGVVNYPRFVRGKNGEQAPLGEERTPNVEMVQLWDPALVSHHVTLPSALALVATEVIEEGSKQFLDYRLEYDLFR